eukprot:3711089-Rhodomonas_salina.1
MPLRVASYGCLRYDSGIEGHVSLRCSSSLPSPLSAVPLRVAPYRYAPTRSSIPLSAMPLRVASYGVGTLLGAGTILGSRVTSRCSAPPTPRSPSRRSRSRTPLCPYAPLSVLLSAMSLRVAP